MKMEFYSYLLLHYSLILSSFCHLPTSQNETNEANAAVKKTNIIRPVLKNDTIQYYDRFGDPTAFPYVGGYLSVDCELPDHKECKENEKVALTKGRWIDDENSDLVKWPVTCNRTITLKLKISKHTDFGKYYCQKEMVPYDGKAQYSLEYINYDYRICTDSEYNIYKQDDVRCSRVGDYCVVSNAGVKVCWDRWDFFRTWCKNEPGIVYCNSHVTRCDDSTYEDKGNAAIRMNGDKCFTGDSYRDGYAKMSIGSSFHGVTYNSLKLIIPAEISIVNYNYIRVSCMRSRYSDTKEMKYHITCELKKSNPETFATTVLETYPIACTDTKYDDVTVALNHSVFSTGGPKILKFTCTVTHNESGLSGKMATYLLAFGTLPIISVTYADGKTETLRAFANLTRPIRQLHCTFPVNMTDGWRYLPGWIKSKGKDVYTDDPVFNGKDLEPQERGAYRCYGNIIYETHSPHSWADYGMHQYFELFYSPPVFIVNDPTQHGTNTALWFGQNVNTMKLPMLIFVVYVLLV